MNVEFKIGSVHQLKTMNKTTIKIRKNQMRTHRIPFNVINLMKRVRQSIVFTFLLYGKEIRKEIRKSMIWCRQSKIPNATLVWPSIFNERKKKRTKMVCAHQLWPKSIVYFDYRWLFAEGKWVLNWQHIRIFFIKWLHELSQYTKNKCGCFDRKVSKIVT